MIRCDLLGPDGPAQDTQRFITDRSGLLSVFRLAGNRRPPNPHALAEWLRIATPNFQSLMQLCWLQMPAGKAPRAEGDTLEQLMVNADAARCNAASSGSSWLALNTLSREDDPDSRRSRHEAAIERLRRNDFLALERLRGDQYAALLNALATSRASGARRWAELESPGQWFSPGRKHGTLRLGNYWWASVCVSSGPSEHLPWSEFSPPGDFPCWLNFRIQGNAQQVFSKRGMLARLLRRAGNESLSDACAALESMQPNQAVAVSLAGLAAGNSPREANANAAALAAQIEAWLGCRVTLSASAISVLALCIPGFVTFRDPQPPPWPATNRQAGELLPLEQPASPWRVPARKTRIIDPFEREPGPFITLPSNEAPRNFPYRSFGGLPTLVTLFAGQTRSGKSIAMSKLAFDFSQRHPGAPIRILDVGESAVPLADIWRRAGHAVATPDLREIPPCNPLKPPFPMLAGGELHLASVVELLSRLVEGLNQRRQGLLERALRIVWAQATRGMLDGRKPGDIETLFAAGDLDGAMRAHAQACPTLRELAKVMSTQAMMGASGDDADAKYLTERITETIGRLPALVDDAPPAWSGAGRVVAELGGQTYIDDPLTPVRYALGVWLLTGDLIPDDWQIASAPGPETKAYIAKRAQQIKVSDKMVICDEIHRLKGDESTQKWIERVAREGAKARLGLNLAAQSATDFKDIVLAQASALVLFGTDPDSIGHFGIDPRAIRGGIGNCAIKATDRNGNTYHAGLRMALTPEQLWALGGAARERALVKALAHQRGSYTGAVTELARRLPGGHLPDDAPPTDELIRAWAA